MSSDVPQVTIACLLTKLTASDFRSDNTTSTSSPPADITVTIPHTSPNELDLTIVFTAYSAAPLPYDAAHTLMDSAYHAAQSFPNLSALVAGGTWRLSYNNLLLHIDETRPTTRTSPPFNYQVIKETIQAVYHTLPMGKIGERGNYFGVQFYIYATRGESETGREDVGWGELRGPDGISSVGAVETITPHVPPPWATTS